MAENENVQVMYCTDLSYQISPVINWRFMPYEKYIYNLNICKVQFVEDKYGRKEDLLVKVYNVEFKYCPVV
jgi:hypothetical protein